MKYVLRDQRTTIAIINGLGYPMEGDKLQTVAEVAEDHTLTEKEAEACLIDLGLIFLAARPADAHKCLFALATLHQGKHGDDA